MAIAVSCNNSPAQEGKPFEELPVLQDEDVLAFFKALPASVLPDDIQEQIERERYFKAFKFMSREGALADGDGAVETTEAINNVVFWSDFLDGYDESKPSDTHPYANIYVYSCTESGKMFGVLKSGSYGDEGEEISPTLCYNFDKGSGKISPAELPLEPKYTAEDLTADVLLTFGSDNLYYAVKNQEFIEDFYDRGMSVMLEDVGVTGVDYKWNGVKFVRDFDSKEYCIYNYAFANFMLLGEVPFSIPGYSTEPVTNDNEYEYKYNVVKDGETEPTLVFHSSTEGSIFEIEVCSGNYCNPYGIYPGMPVTEFLKVLDGVSARMSEPAYFSVDSDAEDFVTIYSGTDEDFLYKVRKEDYLGEEKFAPEARIARVVTINAVG